MNITVVILTYNSNWQKLKSTIVSVVLQTNVNLKIVFADDGSSIKYNRDIVEFLKSLGFEEYEFNDLLMNQGTVNNIYNAIKNLNCDYIKLLSPGDLLYDDKVLFNTIKYMSDNNADVTFGNAVYYSIINDIVKFIKSKSYPSFPLMFNNNELYKHLFVDYVLANDTILGANIIYKADVLKKYIELVRNRLKYAEDLIVKIMLIDNLKILYCDLDSIYYDYGSGISHSKAGNYKIENDRIALEDIILEKYNNNNIVGNRIVNKYINFLFNRKRNRVLQKIFKYINYPEVIYWKIKRELIGKYSKIDCDKEYIVKLLNY